MNEDYQQFTDEQEKNFYEFSERICSGDARIRKVKITLYEGKVEKTWNYELPVTKYIKYYGDACEELNVPANPERFYEASDDEYSFYLLKIVTKALNRGWEPDMKNRIQQKWCPYFDVASDGGFIFARAYPCGTASDKFISAGYRFCFCSEELAIYAGEQFRDLFENFLLH